MPTQTVKLTDRLNAYIEEAIATGEERDGFVKIDGENVAGGWVQRTLVASAPAPN